MNYNQQTEVAQNVQNNVSDPLFYEPAANKKRRFKKPGLPMKILLLIAVAAIILAAVSGIRSHIKREQQEDILTSNTLEKIVEVEELSTYGAIYNSVVKVMNEENPEEIDYYVSYESKVKIGINLDEVNEYADSENRIIRVVLPPVKITDVNVDFASMDFIFVNKGAETESVTESAYKACCADAKAQCENEKDIYTLAKENAENIVKALIEPLISNMNNPYELVIEWEAV